MEWVGFLVPPLLWVNLAFVSPFSTTCRHRLSGMLSVLSGALMFASLRFNAPELPLMLCGAAVAMLAAETREERAAAESPLTTHSCR